MKVFKLICIFALLLIFISACGGTGTQELPSAPAAPAETAPVVPDPTPDPIQDVNLDKPSVILTEEIATQLMYVYAEAMKGGYKDGHIYIHLGDFEFAREYMIDFTEKMVDFIIEEATRINDYLIEFMVLMEWDTEYPGMYLRDYNFVGIVDDIPFVMINVYGITEDLEYLWENFNLDKYELYHSDHIDDSRPREINGKIIIEHGDPLFYGIDE